MQNMMFTLENSKNSGSNILVIFDVLTILSRHAHTMYRHCLRTLYSIPTYCLRTLSTQCPRIVHALRVLNAHALFVHFVHSVPMHCLHSLCTQCPRIIVCAHGCSSMRTNIICEIYDIISINQY